MISMMRAISLSILSALALGCSPAPAVNMAEFNSLSMGDTLAQVESKIGHPGSKVSEAGEFQVYQWINAEGSNVLVTIGPAGLTNKAQAGLK